MKNTWEQYEAADRETQEKNYQREQEELAARDAEEYAIAEAPELAALLAEPVHAALNGWLESITIARRAA
jgi:hypothetical protein